MVSLNRRKWIGEVYLGLDCAAGVETITRR